MAEVVLADQVRNLEDPDPAQRAFDRALRNAFLNGQAYDPDGKGYAYWKAQDEAEEAAPPTSKPHSTG